LFLKVNKIFSYQLFFFFLTSFLLKKAASKLIAE